MSIENPPRRKRRLAAEKTDAPLDSLQVHLEHLDALMAQYIAIIVPTPLQIGHRLRAIVGDLTKHYLVQYGGDTRTKRRAVSNAFDLIQRIFGFSHSKIRLHIYAYDKFHKNEDAREHLCMTDMQLLLGREIGEDIVNAVIQMRKDDPTLPTRAVKALIAKCANETSWTASLAV